MDENWLGVAFRAWREAMGVTLGELSRSLDVSVITITEFETSRHMGERTLTEWSKHVMEITEARQWKELSGS